MYEDRTLLLLHNACWLRLYNISFSEETCAVNLQGSHEYCMVR